MNRTEPREKCDNNCVVCCRTVFIYAIGECDHPVCYECATRMRVLCQQNECPICRRDLPKVVFSEKRKQYADVAKARYQYCDRKYQVYFEDSKVQHAYYKLIEHACPICRDKQMFDTFDALSRHVRKIHDLNYCDICAKHLMIFTHERKCYNRSDLATHKRKGDVDDKSHRGHPLCEFCEERFLDDDELFRHLRREHFYCHFCDMDGLNHYYSDYEYLRKHFRVEHYLCEEGECLNEKFTTAFRTDIDLKAHKATVHNKGLSKAQAKQARTLGLEFTIAPRGPAYAAGQMETWNHPSSRGYSEEGGRREAENGRGNKGRNGRPYYDRGAYAQSNNSRSESQGSSEDFESARKLEVMVSSPQIDMNSSQDFPLLGNDSKGAATQPPTLPGSTSGKITKNASNATSVTGSGLNDTMARKLAKINRFTVGGSLNDDEFPVLQSGENNLPSTSKSSLQPKSNNSWSSSGTATFSVKSSQTPSNTLLSKNTLTLKLNSHEEFPGLVRGSKVKQLAPNVSIQVSHKPQAAHDGPGDIGNLINPKTTNGVRVTSNGSNSREQPVVTRLEGSQNITFLNPPPRPASTTINVANEANGPSFKNGLPKTESGWYVLKKGKHVKPELNEGPKKSGKSLSVNSMEDFPALEVKNVKGGRKETSIVVPISNSWKTSQPDTKNAKVVENSTPSPKVQGKNKKKKKPASNQNVREESLLETTSATETIKESKARAEKEPNIDTNGEGDENNAEPAPAEIKRSEIRVKELSSANENGSISDSCANEHVFKNEDFPCLSVTALPTAKLATPSAFKLDVQPARPPPGFSLPSLMSMNDRKPPPPPPGFEISSVSAGMQAFSNICSPTSPTSVTFTNSSGQNFALPPVMPYYTYCPPTDFQHRNQKLTTLLCDTLSDSEFSTFKDISGKLRQHTVTADEYYQHCVKLIGKEKFEKIFPELLTLLPDISKQHDLLSAYNRQKKVDTQNSAADSCDQFLVCAACQQVLTSADFRAHESMHQMDSNFPSLDNPIETVHVSWLKQH